MYYEYYLLGDERVCKILPLIVNTSSTASGTLYLSFVVFLIEYVFIVVLL